MSEKPIIEEITDTLVDEISKDPSIGSEIGEQVRIALKSSSFNKDKLLKILEHGVSYEDS